VPSRSARASRTRWRASSRRGTVPPCGVASMLAERSRISTTRSGLPPLQPITPLSSGRAAAVARAATPRVRQVRMRMWRSFFFPRDSRVALSRNCMAAHITVLCRLRLSRWMMTGIAAASRPQSRSGWRKDIEGNEPRRRGGRGGGRGGYSSGRRVGWLALGALTLVGESGESSESRRLKSALRLRRFCRGRSITSGLSLGAGR
jgi:hypothetical protein